MNKSTLEQWRMLKAVIDYGGFAQAAAAVHKSQSTVNHAVHKLQRQLDIRLLIVRGRKAQLTDAGEMLLRRASQLLDQAESLEQTAASLGAGEESEVRLAVDEIFPYECLACTLHELATDYPHIRIQLHETVLSGGAEKLLAGEVELLIAGAVPQGFLGNPIMRQEFVAVSHPNHALQQLGRPLNLRDLSQQRQIVVRDSALKAQTDSGWLGAEQRWTVSHLATSRDMIARGMGFAWLPLSRISNDLANGTLLPLPLESGARRHSTLYLILADPDQAGPATRQLATSLTEQARSFDTGE